MQSVRAAEYVRMSTENQKYSTENQRDKIRQYAQSKGIDIVQTYVDAGKSGLNLAGRLGLQQLLVDVQSGTAEFSVILVYDVSRWGRFQNSDESAYYEFVCRRAGCQVIYCGERFDNDDSAMSSIMKNLKRVMAGEYSRELSVKVFLGQSRVAGLGFHVGGTAGYGLRRVVVTDGGQFRAQLEIGQGKALQTDRVVLVPGPMHETQTVLKMYEWFLSERLSIPGMVFRLNFLGIPSESARPWTRTMVNRILTSERYVGTITYNTRSSKLGVKDVPNPESVWVKRENAFAKVVDQKQFEAARKVQRSCKTLSDAELIEGLKSLMATHGKLTCALINGARDLQAACTYAIRFGSLSAAYQLAGYTPTSRSQLMVRTRKVRQHYVSPTGRPLGRLDKTRIDVSSESEVKVWAANFGVSESELRHVVSHTGSIAASVERAIRRAGTLDPIASASQG